MANYIVYVSFTGGKGASVEFRYPNTSTNTGTGHTTTNRLELEAGDTVNFQATSGSTGVGTLSGFASGFWTNTANISFSGTVPNFGTKTVASGTSGTDDILTTVNTATDNFYFEKVAPATAVATPTGFEAADSVGNGGTYPSGSGTTVNLSADALSGHTLQFRQGSGSFSTTSSYSHAFGAQFVYEARYVRTSDSAVSATAASDTLRVADANITIAPVTSLSSGNTQNEFTIASVTNATALTQYRVRATGNINGSSVTNQFINAPTFTGTSGTLTAANPGELPAAGTSAVYTFMARVTTANNGDGSYRFLPTNITNRSWTISRTATDGTPDAFTFTDVTGVALSTTQTSNQITISGIDTTVNVTVSGGTYSKNGGSYTSSAGTAVNGDTFRVRHTSSGSNTTATNTTLTVGGISDTYTSTTAAATFSISAPASINEGSAGTINITTTNVSNGTTVYWELDLNEDYTTSQGSASITSNAASFTITPTADSATEGAQTDTIRLFTDAARTTEVADDSFTINDTSTGSGGSSGGGDGTGNYGISQTGPNGSTIVFGSNLRQMNAVLLASATLNSLQSVSYTGIAEVTNSSKIAIVVAKDSPSYFANQGVSVTRSSASGGTATFTNVSTSDNISIKISIYRIA